jgi:hypothetical protein
LWRGYGLISSSLATRTYLSGSKADLKVGARKQNNCIRKRY